MPRDTDISERESRFRNAVETSPDNLVVFRRAVLHPKPFAVTEEEAFDLAAEVGTHLHIHPNRDIYLVGSAQLGFSISPKDNKRWKPFNDASDIDIAIVSERLFERFWDELHTHAQKPDSWPNRRKCDQSLARGWIRPDYLPTPLADDWFNYFRNLQRTRRYANGIKISAGLYYNMSFLERYQTVAIERCRESIKRSAETSNGRC